MKIAVTGANSSVGLNLLPHLVAQADVRVIAGVRSTAAADSLPNLPEVERRIINYDDVAKLAAAFEGADCVVHLAGILIENRQTNYRSANIDATIAVVAAAQDIGARHLLFVSVLGADPLSKNAYFRSKGVAEQVVEQSGIAATIIRTPLLLGTGTAGANALLAAAKQSRPRLLAGGAYTMRPLDIDDLSTAIARCCAADAPDLAVHELAGPESHSYRSLVEQAATAMGNTVQIGTVPVWLAKLGAAIFSSLRGGGITPAVIDVITADEVVATNADAALGLSLTPMRQTLQNILRNEQGK